MNFETSPYEINQKTINAIKTLYLNSTYSHIPWDGSAVYVHREKFLIDFINNVEDGFIIFPLMHFNAKKDPIFIVAIV